MNISFHPEISSRASSDQKRTIMIRCSQQRQHRRISTGLQVDGQQWDNARKQVRKHPMAKEYNVIIQEKLKKLATAYAHLLAIHDRVTLDDLVSYMLKDQATNFFDFAYSTKMAEIKESKKEGTYRRYEAVLNKLKEYGGHRLSIHRINYTFLKEYSHHLKADLKNSPDTVSANLSVIRTIVNEAERRGLLKEPNPFGKLSLKYTDNTKNKLTFHEMRRMFAIELPDILSLRLARDFFLACFLAEGCRAGDMVKMETKHIQEGFLVYKQGKTGHLIGTPIIAELQEIFDRYKGMTDKYLFPLLDAESEPDELVVNSKVTYINKYLKELAKYCGIFKKLSTHVARHTYTDMALQASQGNIYQVQQSLGHSSVKTTEGYARQSVNFKRTTVVPEIMGLIKS